MNCLWFIPASSRLVLLLTQFPKCLRSIPSQQWRELERGAREGGGGANWKRTGTLRSGTRVQSIGLWDGTLSGVQILIGIYCCALQGLHSKQKNGATQTTTTPLPVVFKGSMFCKIYFCPISCIIFVNFEKYGRSNEHVQHGQCIVCGGFLFVFLRINPAQLVK